MTPTPLSGRVAPLAVGGGLLPATGTPPAATRVPAAAPPSPHARIAPRAVSGSPVTTPPVSIPDVPQPTPTLPTRAGPGVADRSGHPGRSALGVLGGGAALLVAPIAPVTVGTAERLRVPIAFASVLALFVAGQALVSRRDPKLSRSPHRRNDETVPFT